MTTARYSGVQLAERLGVHPVTVTKWRKGTMTPEAHRMRDLAATLGVREEWLSAGTGARREDLSARIEAISRGSHEPAPRFGPQITQLSPREVLRAAALEIADYSERHGRAMPFEELTWWLGMVFEAGGRDTRRALAQLESVSDLSAEEVAGAADLRNAGVAAVETETRSPRKGRRSAG